MEGFVSCMNPLTVGIEQGPISELIRTEAHSYDVLSGIADKIYLLYLTTSATRENKDMIKADWYSVESGFSHTNLSVNSGMFLNFHNFSLECIRIVVIIIVNRLS